MGTSNPFIARKARKGRTYDKEYIHYMEVEEVADPKSFDPEKPSEFLIKKKTVEYERLPISETVNEFASKVGLKNELRGVVSKKQMDDFILAHQAQPGFTDLTKLPDTAFEMDQLAKRVDEAWAKIPDELKGKLSKEDFMKSLTSDQIKAYIQSQIPAEKPQEKVEEK